jgi:hypothetical protein
MSPMNGLAEFCACGRSILSTSSSPGYLERLRSWLRSLTPRQTLALVGLIALGILLVFFIVTRVVPRPLRATVSISGGEVIVLNRLMGTYRTYNDGDLLKVQAGDRLIAVDGSAQVELFPSQVAFVQPGAHIKLAEYADDLGSTQARFFVYRGALRSLVNHPLEAGDQFAVESPAVAASIAAADFTLTVSSPTTADVIVYEGAVDLQKGDESLTVDEGEVVHVVAENPLAAEPVRLAPPTATPSPGP